MTAATKVKRTILILAAAVSLFRAEIGFVAVTGGSKSDFSMFESALRGGDERRRRRGG